jgi:hypothetical protein
MGVELIRADEERRKVMEKLLNFKVNMMKLRKGKKKPTTTQQQEQEPFKVSIKLSENQ